MGCGNSNAKSPKKLLNYKSEAHFTAKDKERLWNLNSHTDITKIYQLSKLLGHGGYINSIYNLYI